MVRPVFNILNISIIFAFSKNLFTAYSRHLMPGFLGLHKNSRLLVFMIENLIHLSILSHFLYHFIYFIYVNDVIITGPSSAVINHLIHKLNSSFAVKDPGPLSFFGVLKSFFMLMVYCFFFFSLTWVSGSAYAHLD
jgi:hypothetical protein